MMGPTTLKDFEAVEVRSEETSIFLRRFGSGPAVLLLHGFPQTHLMWRDVAPVAGSPLHGDLSRSSRLWPQRLSRLASGPCAICEARHGERHDFRHGETWFPALLRCRARSRRSCRVSPCARSPAASGASRGLRHSSDRRRVGAGRREVGYRFLALVAARAARATSRAAGVRRSRCRCRGCAGRLGFSCKCFQLRGAYRVYRRAARSGARPRNLRGVSGGRHHRLRARLGGSPSRAAHRLSGPCALERPRTVEYLVRGGRRSACVVAGLGKTTSAADRSTQAISFPRKFPSERRTS